MVVDYDAPGRKSGWRGLFQRLRCGGKIGIMRGHTWEWVEDEETRYKRCHNCGQVGDVEPLEDHR